MDLSLLIKHLKNTGILKTPEIIEAFERIDRADFVPESGKNLAYSDEALSIGEKQTISQPLTVAFMLELLAPQKGERIMDVGYGSGWQTAILAYIVSQNGLKSKLQFKNQNSECGKIYAIERIPELCEFGGENILKYNFIKNGIVETFCQDAFSGLPEITKKIGGFDGIIAAAALEMAGPKPENALPKAWKEQLKIGGRIVTPIENSVWLFVKNTDGSFSGKEYPGFAFVPFLHNGK